MPPKLRNIIEDIARDYLHSALTLRYDICTCSVCKNDMLAYVLSHVPARYVTTEQGALHTVIQQSRAEHQAEIARAIIAAIDLVSKNPRHKLKEDKAHIFKLLLDKIKEDRGLDLSHYHQDLLKRRVALRMRTAAVETYSDYLRLLMNNPEEYDRLFEVLCINVSEFFRDSEVWFMIGSTIKETIKQKMRNNDNFMRIWSAGCANGEEPYTLSILLRELLQSEIANFTVEIIATDIDKKSISLAEKGQYAKESLRNVEKKLLQKYFVYEDGLYKVKDEVKNLVSFKYLDLTSQDLIKDTDLVVCRNVFIYFDRSLQEQIIMKYYRSLKPGGYLFMGKAETLIREAREIFDEIDFDTRLYRKKQ